MYIQQQLQVKLLTLFLTRKRLVYKLINKHFITKTEPQYAYELKVGLEKSNKPKPLDCDIFYLNSISTISF